MLNKKPMLSPEQVRSLRQIRGQLENWFFFTTWQADENENPFGSFSSPHADELLLVLDDLNECGWNWSFTENNSISIRISPASNRVPSSEVLPTPAEIEMFCQAHEKLLEHVKNLDTDSPDQKEIIFPDETPDRIMRGLLYQLERVGWNAERREKSLIIK